MSPPRHCEVYVDGASRGNPGPAGVGVVLLEEGNQQPVGQVSRYIGETTNNVAEYCALIFALQEALRRGYTHLSVKTDSELLASQVMGRYKVRDAQLRLLYQVVLHGISCFENFKISHIPRELNQSADRLAGAAVSRR